MPIADWGLPIGIVDWGLSIGRFFELALQRHGRFRSVGGRYARIFSKFVAVRRLRVGWIMNLRAEELKRRAHEFFIRVIALCRELPKTVAADSIASQLVDSAGSANSNYRAACKGRSRKEFIAKIGVAAEEADESVGWLEALRDAKLGKSEEVLTLIKEADELTSIFVASRKTAESRLAAEHQLRASQKQARRRRT